MIICRLFQTPACLIPVGALFAANSHRSLYTALRALTLPTSSAVDTTGYYFLLKKHEKVSRHPSVNFLKTEHIPYGISGS